MIQPRRVGRFLAVDELGYVQPDVAIDRIGSNWKLLVEFVTRRLIERHGVRSVYIRGSIPRGLAIEYVSDADFIYFSESDFDAADAELEQAAKAAFSFLNGLELSRLGRVQFDKVHHPQQRPYFHMLLKTQCLFLSGDDVARDIAPFKIGPDMVSHVFSLANEFSKISRGLERGQDKNAARSAQQWISKRIVRSGFEVTMDRSDRFTRDLYLCYEQFEQFYPDRSGQMYQVLVNCLNGDESPARYEELVDFLAHEGSRLLA